MDYKICLSIILIGAIFSALTSVIITVLIAMRYTLIQMIVYIVISVISYFISNILVLRYGIMGAAISYSLIMIINCIVFYLIYMIIVKRTKLKNIRENKCEN